MNIPKLGTIRQGGAWQSMFITCISATDRRRHSMAEARSWQRAHQLHETDTALEFLSQLVREMVAAVPLGHHVNLLAKIERPTQRAYYLQATARFGWSRNVLMNQITAGPYGRSLAERKRHNFKIAMPEHVAEQVEEALKSSYNLEFLGIRRRTKERELEDRLID